MPSLQHAVFPCPSMTVVLFWARYASCMHRAILILLLVGTVGAAFALGGCKKDSPPGVEGTGTRSGSGDAVLWPFWPVRMAVHPASRMTISTDDGERHYEARIAFYDRFGDICKAVGEIRIELQDPRGMQAIMPAWTIDLRDLEANHTHFDDVTRTYLFKLRIEEDMTPEAARLKVYFLAEDGQQFEIDQGVRLR